MGLQAACSVCGDDDMVDKNSFEQLLSVKIFGDYLFIL